MVPERNKPKMVLEPTIQSQPCSKRERECQVLGKLYIDFGPMRHINLLHSNRSSSHPPLLMAKERFTLHDFLLLMGQRLRGRASAGRFCFSCFYDECQGSMALEKRPTSPGADFGSVKSADQPTDYAQCIQFGICHLIHIKMLERPNKGQGFPFKLRMFNLV